MDLLSPKIIKELLFKYDASPSKRFGQNFLVNAGVLKKIIDAADLNEEGAVLEIGPGLGTLTQALAQKVKKVVAIEKDKRMVEILKETLSGYKNIKIVQGDILRPDIGSLEIGSWKLIGNLPYYITSPVIRKFLEIENKPSEMILMVQKEVAQRICALPPNMNLLAVAVQYYAKPNIVSLVSAGSFWPSPKVDSAILRITPLKSDFNKSAQSLTSTAFFRVVRAGFSAPRKQLAGNLVKKLRMDKNIVLRSLQKTGVDAKRRAETLSIEDWVNLTNKLVPVLNQ